MLGFRRRFGRTKLRCHRRLQFGHRRKQKEIYEALADSDAPSPAAFVALRTSKVHGHQLTGCHAVVLSPYPLSRQFQRRCKGVNRRMSFVSVFQVGCEQSGVVSGHDGS